MDDQRSRALAPLFVALARATLALAVGALLGAWVTQLTGAPLLGMSQQHSSRTRSRWA
jgi:hypothetical protein